jgi:excinuclease UvrABC nuclease subunit
MNGKIKLNRLFDDCEMPIEGRTCIYSLFDNGTCVYVGQSSNVKSRVYSHLSLGKSFDSFDFEYCEDKDANEAEASMIIKNQPTLNKILPPTKKYISLTAMSAQITQLLFDNKEDLNFSFSGAAHKNPKLTKRYISTDSAEKIKLSILGIVKLGDKKSMLGALDLDIKFIDRGANHENTIL